MEEYLENRTAAGVKWDSDWRSVDGGPRNERKNIQN